MSGSLHLSNASSDKNRVEEEAKCSSQEGDPVEVWRFCLDDIKGLICTTWKVTILPFSMVSMHVNSSVKGHCMQVHMLTEPMPGPQLLAAVVPMPTYGELHPGSSRVPICLHNLSACAVEIPTKAVDGHCTCQPSTTGSPPSQDYQRVKIKTPKRIVLGCFRPPRPPRVA